MPAINRKRRAPAAADSDSDDTPPARSRPCQSQAQAQPRRRRQPSTPAADPTNASDSTPEPTQTTSPQTLQVKALVRLALSTSVTRASLRRTDINVRAGTTHGTFRAVIDEANQVLRDVWGMQLTELPGREDVTLAQRQKRMATQTQKGERERETQNTAGGGGSSTSTKSWILTSALPTAMRAVLGQHAFPSIASTSTLNNPASLEASYTALSTFIISLINLSGGSLPENKLTRHLARVNADTSTPVDGTEKTLARMIKEGYIVRIKEGAAGEDPVVEFRVGPRGRVEVGEGGTAGLVRAVYGVGPGDEVDGEGGDAEEVRREELERRIERSLKLVGGRAAERQAGNGGNAEAGAGSRGGGRRTRRARDEDEDD